MSSCTYYKDIEREQRYSSTESQRRLHMEVSGEGHAPTRLFHRNKLGGLHSRSENAGR
jgi:hypothetical protein